MDEAYQETIDMLSDKLAEAQDRVKYLEEELVGVTSNLEFEYKDGLRNTKIRADLTERLRDSVRLIERMHLSFAALLSCIQTSAEKDPETCILKEACQIIQKTAQFRLAMGELTAAERFINDM